MVVFCLVRSIIFNIPRSLSPADKSSIPPFLAILVLGDTRIHISSSYHGNVTSYVKASINKHFGSRTLWKSQILIQIITMSDLGKSLITYSLEAM